MEDGAMPDTDTVTTDTVDTVDTAPSPAKPDAPAPSEADLGDGGKAALAAERDARKAAEKQARELQKSLKEYEDRDKTELQKWQERAEAAEKRAEQAEYASLRSKVAAQKGVPASSLTGTTEDELLASADELIAWRDQQNTPPKAPAPKRAPAQGGLKSGATGNENTNYDPKVAAAEALRRLRSS